MTKTMYEDPPPPYQQTPTVVIYVTTQGQPVPPPYPQPLLPAVQKPSHKAQSKALGAGGLIFISAGMNMAKGLSWSDSYPGIGLTYFSMWFIGVIIGVLLAAPLVKNIQKRIMFFVSCLLILIEGVLYATLPFTDDAKYVGRSLNGIAVGFALIPFLTYGSEISSKANRGLCAIEQYSFTIGIALQMNLTAQWNYNYELIASDRLHGILDIVFALLAASALASVIESPIFHLQKENDAQAFDSIMRLDNLKFASANTYAKYEECKDYLRHQETLSLMDSVKVSAMPLIKMIIFRSMMLAFTFSTPLSQTLIFTSVAADAQYWAPTTAACMRLVGSFLAICLVNGVTRKLISLISISLMSILVVFIAINFGTVQEMEISNHLTIVVWSVIVMQLFAGLYAPYTSVHVAEAFSLKCKPYFIAICVIVEQILQLIVINIFNSWDYTLNSVLWVHGIFICFGCIVALLTMPETKGTTLKEAQQRFEQLFYLKLH